MNADFSTSLDNAINFMDLNTGRSWTYSINFIQHSFGLGTDKAGIVTGLGIEWSNYNFDRDFSIRKDSTGNIVPYPLASLGSILKNKVQTTYLTLPLLIEFQIPAQKKIIYPVHKTEFIFQLDLWEPLNWAHTQKLFIRMMVTGRKSKIKTIIIFPHSGMALQSVPVTRN
jgi:hypothetical protein